jgi:hypothetical protein
MNRSIKLVAATFAASSMLLATLGMTAARAQDADSELTPSSTITQVAGTWTGTDSEGGVVQGPATLDLTQNGKSIGGTFSVTTDGETPGGKVNGHISGDDLKLTFHATMGTKHNCVAAVLATVDTSVTPATMEGTFLVKGSKKHCNGKGTFDLTLQ